MGDSTCNWLATCSLLLTVVSFFLLIVGAVSDGWVKLYKDPDDIWGYTYFKGRYTSAGKATFALSILAALSAAVSIIFLSIYLFASQIGSTNKVIEKFKVVIACLSGIGGVCGVICCIVFGVTFYQNGPYEKDYSFFLTLVGSILLLIAGVVGFMSRYKIKEPISQTRPAGIMVNHQGVTYYVPARAYPMKLGQASANVNAWGAGDGTPTPQGVSSWVQPNNTLGQSNFIFGHPTNMFGTDSTVNQ